MKNRQTVRLIYYSVIANTLLWSCNELTDEANRTASFISTEIIMEDTSMQFYSLNYQVQHAEYNLTLYTSLVPLNAKTYNSSFTIMNYALAGKSEVASLEFVEFSSSVTLSQQYAILGKVAKEIGKVYEKSGDETLAQIAQSYYTMKEEAQYLSKLVEKQLQRYDLKVLESSAILTDVPYEVCVGLCLIEFCVTNWFYCQILCGGLCYPCITGFWPSCPPCAVCIGIPALYCLIMCI